MYQRKVPESVSQQNVSCNNIGGCKRKEIHLMHMNILLYCVSLCVTSILEIRYEIQP